MRFWRALLARFERRAGITSSHALYEHLSRGSRSLAGVEVTEATVMQVAAVLTCVNGISTDISSLPVDVIERVDERRRRPATSHPLRRVLFQPNSWQTTAEWVSMQVAHILLRGNAFNLIVRSSIGDRDQVQELLPMHPDAVSVEQVSYPNLSFVYRWTDKSGKTHEFLNRPGQPPQVLHFRGLSTNGVIGRSVIEDAREAVGVALATQRHAATFWSRGGLPQVVLRHPKTVGAGKKNLEESWSANYGGGDDQSRVAVLEEGMDISTLSVKPEDAQFLETRKFQRGEIFGLFRYPPHMAGDTEKSTSWGTGIEQQQIGYLTFTLNGLIRRMEQRMDRDLVRVPDKYSVKFFPQAFMRGDAGQRSTFYQRMVSIGAFSPNDVRLLEDMNPIDGGDVYLQPANFVPLGTEAEPAPGVSTDAA